MFNFIQFFKVTLCYVLIILKKIFFHKTYCDTIYISPYATGKKTLHEEYHRYNQCLKKLSDEKAHHVESGRRFLHEAASISGPKSPAPPLLFNHPPTNPYLFGPFFPLVHTYYLAAIPDTL